MNPLPLTDCPTRFRSQTANHASALAALLLAIALPLLAAEADWPRFRGPNGSGLGVADLPAQWTPANRKWSVKLPGVGHGYARAPYGLNGVMWTCSRLPAASTMIDARPYMPLTSANEPDAKAILPEPRSVQKSNSYQ